MSREEVIRFQIPPRELHKAFLQQMPVVVMDQDVAYREFCKSLVEFLSRMESQGIIQFPWAEVPRE